MSRHASPRVLATSIAVVAMLVVGTGAALANGSAGAWMNAVRHKVSAAEVTPAAPPPQAGTPPTGAVPGQFTTEQFTSSTGQHMTYYLYVPANYVPSAHYPLVLLLHGGGERSAANNSATKNRAVLLGQQYVQDWIAPAVQSRWPSFVVVPQVAGSNQWVNVPASQGSYKMQVQPSASLQMATDIVATIEMAYPSVNTNRLYVTGLSMGGYGTWDIIERWPTLFAAAVPLSGAGDPSRAAVLAKLPIWAFHGSGDTTVPVSGSRDMIAAIRKAGGSPCYTEYPGQEHGIWNTERVYANNALLTWLFAQSRSASGSAHQNSSCPLA
jgi:predicted peptidase